MLIDTDLPKDMSEYLKKELIETLTTLPSKVYDYKRMKLVSCEIICEHAAYVTIKVPSPFNPVLSGKPVTLWIPKNAMKLDDNNNLFVENRFYDKEIYMRL